MRGSPKARPERMSAPVLPTRERLPERAEKKFRENLKKDWTNDPVCAIKHVVDGSIAQLVRAFGSHPRGLGFESQCFHEKRTPPCVEPFFVEAVGLRKQAEFLSLSRKLS